MALCSLVRYGGALRPKHDLFTLLRLKGRLPLSSSTKEHLSPLEAEQNKKVNDEVERKLREELALIKEGGGEASVALHLKRNRVLVRDRVKGIIDAGSSFLELSEFAGHGLYKDVIPAGGIITGIGQIKGVPCVIIANDPTVKGGTYYPATGWKHMRAQAIGWQNKLPCVYLVDSGGGYLPLQAQGFADRDHFGRVFYNQANMSAEGIPQISVVFGPCTAGGAYIPCMSDENIIVEKHGHIYLGGPPLVKAALGEEVTSNELGGATLHCKVSGVSDYYSPTEQHAMQLARDLVMNLNLAPETQPFALESYDSHMNEFIPAHQGATLPLRHIMSRLVDEGHVVEFKEKYGTSLVTVFARIGSRLAGIVMNHGHLCGEGALKGTHFIQLCSQRKIPLFFLQDIPSTPSPHTDPIVARNIGKMIHAVSVADVPKATFILGGSFGEGNYALCGRSFSPNFLFAWPRSRIAMTDPSHLTEQYNIKAHEMSALHASARLWNDGIVLPGQTRSVMNTLLQIFYRAQSLPKRSLQDTYGWLGVFRM